MRIIPRRVVLERAARRQTSRENKATIFFGAEGTEDWRLPSEAAPAPMWTWFIENPRPLHRIHRATVTLPRSLV